MSTDNKNFGGKDQGKQKPIQEPNRTGTQQGGFQKPQQPQGGHQQGQDKNKAWDQNKGNLGGKKDRNDQR